MGGWGTTKRVSKTKKLCKGFGSKKKGSEKFSRGVLKKDRSYTKNEQNQESKGLYPVDEECRGGKKKRGGNCQDLPGGEAEKESNYS